MPRVPDYEPSVTLRPAYRQGIDVRATPEAFGADIGRGMVNVAQGIANVGTAMERVQELEDTARAKEADNSYSDWVRERMYGENGFMTLEGRNAVDSRSAFEKEAAEKRKEYGAGLTPGAARAYQTASQARLQSIYNQSIVHTANARKTWFKEAGAARVETFANDALVNFHTPALVTKNLAAGVAEIREQGRMQGWDADTLKLREAEFVSGVHKNITLRLAQDDPLAADKYMRANTGQMTGAHQYDLNKTLETSVKSELAKRAADEILTGGRRVEGSAAPSPGAPPPPLAAGRTVANSGPTSARSNLYKRIPSGRSREHVDGLNAPFASNLSAMFEDAPPGIREGLQVGSGFRSEDRQEELFNDAVRKYGSEAAARKWVAKPESMGGKGSNHTHGNAVDIWWNGTRLDKAPANVREWVHGNAAKYGLYFPMGHEPWHVEARGTRGTTAGAPPAAGAPGASTVVARNNGVATRSTMPSYDDIEARLAAIPDPDVRDLARKRIYAGIEAQSKAAEANEKAAKAELWRYIDQGKTPDDVPLDVRQGAGMAAVSAAWSYMETAAKGRAVDSDETLVYDMRKYAAENPTEFAKVDLNDYRDRLSKADIKELTGVQTTALTDQRKAREDGLTLTSAFSQATSQLEAVGITTTGKEGNARVEAAKRIASFQNALAAELEAFKKANNGRNPTQVDIQAAVNKLMLPIVVKTPGTLWDTKTPGFMFEAGGRPDGSTVDVVVKITDIPIDLRRGIALDLERELGRKPSQDEVVQRYEDFILSK